MNQKHWILLFSTCVAITISGLAYASQAGKEYNDSDKQLNVSYQKALVSITDPEDRRSFVEAQKSWIKFREAHAAFHGRYFPDSKGGLFEATEMTQERTKYFNMLLTSDARQAHDDRHTPGK